MHTPQVPARLHIQGRSSLCDKMTLYDPVVQQDTTPKAAALSGVVVQGRDSYEGCQDRMQGAATPRASLSTHSAMHLAIPGNFPDKSSKEASLKFLRELKEPTSARSALVNTRPTLPTRESSRPFQDSLPVRSA